jgi:hypothetical protein
VTLATLESRMTRIAGFERNQLLLLPEERDRPCAAVERTPRILGLQRSRDLAAPRSSHSRTHMPMMFLSWRLDLAGRGPLALAVSARRKERDRLRDVLGDLGAQRDRREDHLLEPARGRRQAKLWRTL